MKSIYLIDGSFFIKKFQRFVKSKHASAFASRTDTFPLSSDISLFVTRINAKLNSGYPIIRIYFYDCYPLEEDIINPISGATISLKASKEFLIRKNLLDSLKITDLVSVREGSLDIKGWKIRDGFIKSSISGCSLSAADVQVDIQQKGVDLKIGIDIAWISLQKIAERIIIVTGDSDFIPAMKMARRNGIQVSLFTLGHGVMRSLKDHTDFLNTMYLDELLK